MTWQASALCAQVDPEIFTPNVYNVATTREAKATCGQCEVRAECLADALAEEGTRALEMRASVRGGTTPRERHAIARPRKPATA